MKVTIEVAIPDSEECSGCRFLVWHEESLYYDCALFAEELTPLWPKMPTKCLECKSLKGN